MTEDNQKKSYSINEKIMLGITISVFTILSINVIIWAIGEIQAQSIDKILGYNKDGYFCKGVNIDRYFPLEDCKKSINNSGKTVEEVEAEGTI